MKTNKRVSVDLILMGFLILCLIIWLIVCGCANVDRQTKIAKYCADPKNECVDAEIQDGVLRAKGYEFVMSTNQYDDQVDKQLEDYCKRYPWKCWSLLDAEKSIFESQADGLMDKSVTSNETIDEGNTEADTRSNNDVQDTDDGNNGHGNDPGGYDSSNPGKSSGSQGKGK